MITRWCYQTFLLRIKDITIFVIKIVNLNKVSVIGDRSVQELENGELVRDDIPILTGTGHIYRERKKHGVTIRTQNAEAK